MQVLKRAVDVVDALGGPSATARLVGTTPSNVWAWKKLEKIPSKYHPRVLRLLRERNYTAPLSLFGLVE